MNSTSIFSDQSELALAAYAKNLYSGMPIDDYRLALEDGRSGMSEKQAAIFATTYDIVEQFNDAGSGLSVTLFRNIASGDLHLAIRGTETSVNDYSVSTLLALGVSEKLNPQFVALKACIDNWLNDTTRLQGHTFTVSGHSLGGYLAAAVKEQYHSATEAYVFNAPGTGGLVGTIAGLVFSLFGGQQAPGSYDVWNIKASEGLTFAAGLGGRALGVAQPVLSSRLDSCVSLGRAT